MKDAGPVGGLGAPGDETIDGSKESVVNGSKADETPTTTEQGHLARVWAGAEAAFDSSPALSLVSMASLQQGSVIAWKELELNEYTFTPELALHLARLVTAGEAGLEVEELDRPAVVDDYEAAEPTEPETKVSTISKLDVLGHAGKWRVIVQ